MSRTPAGDESDRLRALEAVRRARSAEELRAAQAALLPLLGFSADETSQVVGRKPAWVSRTRSAWLRGEPAPKLPGGRRGNRLSDEQELAVFVEAALKYMSASRARIGASPGAAASFLFKAVEGLTTHRLSEATLYALQERLLRTLFTDGEVGPYRADVVRMCVGDIAFRLRQLAELRDLKSD